jgi:hypothetical protein
MTDNAKLESKQDHTDLSGTRISSGSTLLHARQATDEQKRQAEAEVVKGRQQLAEQKAANEAKARKESERLLANVASDARPKVVDAIKQLAEGATSLE